MQKAPIFRVLVGIKKTETPIFQGISAVLPKVYLGGRSVGIRTRSSMALCANCLRPMIVIQEASGSIETAK